MPAGVDVRGAAVEVVVLLPVYKYDACCERAMDNGYGATEASVRITRQSLTAELATLSHRDDAVCLAPARTHYWRAYSASRVHRDQVDEE